MQMTVGALLCVRHQTIPKTLCGSDGLFHPVDSTALPENQREVDVSRERSLHPLCLAHAEAHPCVWATRVAKEREEQTCPQ